MIGNAIDEIGNLNPQMWREIKGRLKPRNIVISVAISLLTQFLLVQYFLTQLPSEPISGKFRSPIYNTYCTGKRTYEYSSNVVCIRDSFGNFIINWELWNRDVFVCLSFVAIFSLLVIGTYLLINDLSQEERRGTLNFIRLSPQSNLSILIGKIFGVPILLYLAIVLAIPLHLWTGISGIGNFEDYSDQDFNFGLYPLGQIGCFYCVVIACCILFYSAALLYSLVSNWLGGFQPWLGTGVVLGFLWLNYLLTYSPLNTPLSWLRLLTPFDLIPDVLHSSFYRYNYQYLSKSLSLNLQWYNLPIGEIGFFRKTRAFLRLFSLLNFALWNCWIWQALNRSFRNPNKTILSKGQSYLLTACFQISLIGFTVPGYTSNYLSAKDWLFQHFMFLCALNFLLFLVLIAILSPHRQVLHDWARYRHQNQGKSLIKDLIFGEKSPALVAIAINLGIAITAISLWSLSSAAEFKYKAATLVSLAFAFTLVMLYAVLTQILLFVRIKNNIIWAIGALSASIFLPLIGLAVFQVNPDKSLGFLWYFSVLAPLATYWEETPVVQIFVSALAQWTVIGLLTVQLTRKLQLAGESATKALLQERKALPARNL
ncbi:hypothetical protein ACE1B6_12440 [Aerosakkonemataceae cyanobacterium BLCC-F154]|uniref:ABC transporter permease n=1 Tax=Floridaenema fluviatile BLCC-F154 TaxID=3153640 RepID=A0ABV4YB63_9CYAN